MNAHIHLLLIGWSAHYLIGIGRDSDPTGPWTGKTEVTDNGAVSPHVILVCQASRLQNFPRILKIVVFSQSTPDLEIRYNPGEGAGPVLGLHTTIDYLQWSP